MSSRFLNISTDNTLGGGSASDEIVSSQKAVKDYVDSHGGSVTTDGVTINTNTDDELQAIGVIEKNAGNVKYDWVGTSAEYTAQNVATLHPTWVCYITDDEVQATGDFVTSYKLPTSADPTWYRIYKSGWVEQGGLHEISPASTSGYYDVTLPIEMENTKYTVFVSATSNDSLTWNCEHNNRSATGIRVAWNHYNNQNTVVAIQWEVKGVKA